MRAAGEAEYRDYVAARSHALWHTAFLMCGDAHQAEDVVQTAPTGRAPGRCGPCPTVGRCSSPCWTR